MGSETVVLPFREAVEVNPKVSLKSGTVYPFVEMKAIEPSRRNVSESEFRVAGGGSRFEPGDTLMARITPCLENGKVARYLPSAGIDGPAFGSTEFIVIRGRKGVTTDEFAYYLTKSPEFHSFAVAQMTGSSGRQRVPVEAFDKYLVEVPPIEEQKRIAHILGTLDDKIELNRQMNRTLEEMARALFKSWFVDFDPVRAKMSGRWTRTAPLPGLPTSLFDLFPDHLVDSELGEIPAGWEVRSVWDMAEFVNGAAYSAFEPNDERIGLPIVKIAELKAGITHQTKFSSVQMLDRYRIKDGDILFSWSGNPDTSIDTFVWSGGPAWLNQHIFKVIPNRPEERTFVLMLLLSLKPVFAEIARDKQTTGLGHVTAGDLRRLSIVVPCSIIMREWERMIGPVALALHQNTVVGRMLEELREVQLESLIPA